MKVKIFGERNTGTRALKALLERNLDVECLPGTEKELWPECYDAIQKDEPVMDALFATVPPSLAWKHSATCFADYSSLADCRTVFTVRHPLSWLVGFFKRPYHHLDPVPDTIGEFAAQPWRTVKREHLDQRALKPLDLYREKVLSYLSSPLDGTFVRFEDLILDQEKVMRSFGVRSFETITGSTKPNDPRTLEEMQAYYRGEKWRDQLDGVTEEPDWELFSRFGYTG